MLVRTSPNCHNSAVVATKMFSIKDFILETKEDFNSPTTSTFSSNIANCKQMVNAIEESLDFDRNGLSKMKKSVKAIHNGGCVDSENKTYLSESLEKMGIHSTAREKEEFISAAFVKFSFIFKELASLEKSLMQNLHNTILFPLDNVLKGDLKGVKNDLKKPVEKAWKEYDTKIAKIEKEKKAQAKEAGLVRTEISGAELAEEMDRERKQFQYQLCEYFIKANEIETKKNFDLLAHFIEHFNAICEYFRGGLEAIEQFQTYIAELSVKIQQTRQRHEDEKRELIDLRSLLKSSSTIIDLNSQPTSSTTVAPEMADQANRRSIGYSLHQLQGNQEYGEFKSGYLLKKSEGKMRVKVWQKRKCEVKSGFLYIWHSDNSKPPTKISLLTCQIKRNVPSNPEDKSSVLFFDLISCNRTYHFQVEDEHDVEAWISVLVNNKENAMKKEFDNTVACFTPKSSLSNHKQNQQTSSRELQQAIIEQIKKLPGNNCCVDCNSTKDPTWLAVNFGVLTCIECSGIHREMGVHVSRIQSLTLDNIGTSQLLIARAMGNTRFNEIMEAGCGPNQKPNITSKMDERNQFIRAKYIMRKYIIRTCNTEPELRRELEQAVQTKDIMFLLQVWAEGANLCWPLPSNSLSETALHYAIMHEFDGSSLHIVDFIVQNSSNLNLPTVPDGNTPLHYCVLYNRSECMKLLLRSNADYSSKNAAGKTPLDISREETNTHLIDLLEKAVSKQKALFENVDWSYQPEDPPTDFSDDDIEDKNWINTEEIGRFKISKFPVGPDPRSQVSNYKSSSRPSSVVGNDGMQVVNNLNNSFDFDHSFVHGNPIRTSGRNRTRLPSNHQQESLIDTSNNSSMNNSHLGFVVGHSRAASADITSKHSTPLSQARPQFKNGQYHHSRNNSMDNSIGKSSPIQQPPAGVKPAIPAKPSGIVSVFVPGSSTPNSQVKTPGSIYTKPPSTINVSPSYNSRTASFHSPAPMASVHPIPPPRKKPQDMSPMKLRRCVALYDCEADQEDELSFKTGEVITVINEETTDEEWMEGFIEADPSRRGLFPAIFVEFPPSLNSIHHH